MRRLVLLGLVALAFVAATTGSAAQGKQISIDINDSFQDPDLSAASTSSSTSSPIYGSRSSTTRAAS